MDQTGTNDRAIVSLGGIGTLIEDRKQFDEANALSLLSIAHSVERVAASGTPEVSPATYRELGIGTSPRAHMRIQVTKNTKGYSYETSVSVDGDDLDTVRTSVEQLLIDADTIARQEITRRELLDDSTGSSVEDRKAIAGDSGSVVHGPR